MSPESGKLSLRQVMPKEDPAKRRHSFVEVARGFTPEQARLEANRCLQCRNRPCTQGCPVEVEIPEFIAKVAAGDLAGAAAVIKRKNSLPAVCGRVCPQEQQCEAKCVRGKKGEPVAIGALERFVADWEAQAAPQEEAATGEANRREQAAAVVGSGPAGLTCAADLAKLGYRVTLFESLHAAGGVLRYGIPEFRLPKAILDRELAYLQALGVEIKLNTLIGQTLSLDDLFAAGYGAVFLGLGAGLPYFLGVPGENLNGVYSANEFLTRINLMKGYLFPEYDTPVSVGARVAVIGAGNVAMDAARAALRLGVEEVSIVYRRSAAEMPARAEEIANAEEEGVQFHLLTNPVAILDNGQGWVGGLRCQRMELAEPDASGRRRPVPVPDSEFTLPADTVIIAIGQGPNPLLVRATPGLATNERGNIIADPETGATSIPGVFAGGDIVTGAATVILAMGAGKRAARAMDRFLQGRDGNA